MLYLLAAIGLVTVGVLFWRLLGHERIGVSAPKSTLAPDDDPDFLRRLGEQTRREEGPDNPA